MATCIPVLLKPGKPSIIQKIMSTMMETGLYKQDKCYLKKDISTVQPCQVKTATFDPALKVNFLFINSSVPNTSPWPWRSYYKWKRKKDYNQWSARLKWHNFQIKYTYIYFFALVPSKRTALISLIISISKGVRDTKAVGTLSLNHFCPFVDTIKMNMRLSLLWVLLSDQRGLGFVPLRWSRSGSVWS